MELLTIQELEALREFDSPTICNAVEGFHVRDHTSGYTRPGLIRRVSLDGKPMVGYARTARISAFDPMDQRHWTAMEQYYRQYENFDLPQVSVIQDVDETPIGSFWGDVQATVHRALGCVGGITNGGVRDLKEVESVGFHLFSKVVLVAHANVHIVEAGVPVTVFGLTVYPGDLIHADYHGAVIIPGEIAKDVARACQQAMNAENALLVPCRNALMENRRVTAAQIMEWRKEMQAERARIGTAL